MVDYLTVFATLLGAVIGGIIGFVGAYLVQKQLFKRERVTEMRDKIYGPILMETNDILEATRRFENSDPMIIQRLKEIAKNYLFLTYTDQDLKSKLSELIDRIGKYNTLKIAAQELYNNITQKEIRRAFGADIGATVYQVYLNLLIGNMVVNSFYLHQAIFLKSNLKDFVEAEKEKWGKDITVEAYIGGKRSPEDFESLCTNVGQEIEKEPLYQEERTQRMRLIEELEHFSEKIKELVKS
jgi:gas vesicle protein